jgi:hypothetical protein
MAPRRKFLLRQLQAALAGHPEFMERVVEVFGKKKEAE